MGDTISRQAAIDTLMEKDKKLRNINWYDKPYAEAECRGIDEALSIISNLPSAQPERKKGKWIEVDDSDNRISGRCSICDWEALLYETDVVGMDYCPNCGADMRGGLDEVD